MTALGAQPVVFESAMEGLGRSFRRRLPPEALEELRRLGVDFDRVQPAYPREVWEQALRLVARALFPGEPDEVAWRRLGREFIAGFTETMVGKAILAVGRAIGPRRFLSRLGRTFRAASNYAAITVEHTGPAEAEIVSALEPEFLQGLRDPSSVQHHYRHGVIEAGLAAAGVQAEVELLSLDTARQVARYRARWRA